MVSAETASLWMTIGASILGAIFLLLLVFMIIINKDLLSKPAQGNRGIGANEEQYQRMKAHPGIDEDSGFGIPVNKNTVLTKNMIGSKVETDGGKASSKSLMI